jgi:hypothetical protein
MIIKLLQLCGLVNSPTTADDYDPVFGLPKRSLEEWLARHPSMRPKYDAELKLRTKRGRRSFMEERNVTADQ